MTKWIAAILFFTSFASAATNQEYKRFDGNEFLNRCGDVLHGDIKSNFNSGYCLGYLEAVETTEGLWFVADRDDRHIAGAETVHSCIPEEVTNLQLLKVAAKWLNDHPQNLHWAAAASILVAFKEAYPCK